MASAQVGDIDDAFEWSVSRLARCFGLHRQTVKKRLTDAGVVPSDVRRGAAVYHVRDASPAILAPDMEAEDPAFYQDPAKMQPSDRKDWFQSEQARVNLEKELRQLIHEVEVRREFAGLVKNFTAFLDQLLDMLDRAGVDPDKLDQVEKELDSLREQLYQQVMEYEAPGDDAGEG